MENNDALMSTMDVKKAIAKMAIPSVISSLVTIIYNLADTFFVGQTNSSIQVAAVSLTNPIFIFMMACSNMLGMGGSVVASTALGQKKPTKSKQASAFVFYAALSIGIAIMIILLVFMQEILELFGADASTYAAAQGYATYIAFGAPCIVFSAAASHIVRSEGSSKEAMLGNMIGTISNIVMDPIFISGFGLGAAGAAIATSLGNLFACIYYLWYFLKRTPLLSIAFRYFTLKIGPELCKLGLPSAILSVLMSVSTIILNQMLVVYGNDPVAAIGIVFKANMFITFLQMGIANGIQPLLGYNYGAHNQERFMRVARYSLACCIVIGTLCTLLFIFGRETIIRLFIDDDGVVSYGAKMLVAYSLSGPFIGILFINMNCLQATNHAFQATILSVLRQGLLLIPLLYLLNALFGLNGIIFAQSIGDIATVLLSIILWMKVKKEVFV